jgi:hypothetical protein
MSDRPTTETDAAAWVETNQANALVLASFARNLERQRDEARELARELRDALSRLRSQMQIADNDHELTVRFFQIPTGEVRRADLFLTRAKEVLP